MTQSNSEHNTSNKDSQESWEDYFARISAPGYQSPGFVPDDEPLSHNECLLSLVDTLHRIAESLHNIDDGIWYLCGIEEQKLEAYKERTQAIIEENRLREEEPHDQYYSPSPPPPSQTKPRTTETKVSPGVKRLRQIEKGGGQP